MTATRYEGPTTFAVIDTAPSFRGGGRRGRVVLETNDWLEAEHKVRELAALHPGRRGAAFTIDGTHPTHVWVSGRCTACEGWDNGSYGSHAPCGFTFGAPLVTYVKAWAVRRTHERLTAEAVE